MSDRVREALETIKSARRWLDDAESQIVEYNGVPHDITTIARCLLTEAIAALAAATPGEAKRGRCQGCGEIVTADHGLGHTRSEHAPSCRGECRECPVPVACGPVDIIAGEPTPETVDGLPPSKGWWGRAQDARDEQETVERVARAIYVYAEAGWPDEWETLPERTRMRLLGAASAALRAVGEGA